MVTVLVLLFLLVIYFFLFSKKLKKFGESILNSKNSLIKWILQSLNSIKDIKISKKGPLKKILKESKMMIHNRCTTGLEAYIAGVPVISFEPIKLSEPPHPPLELINAFAHYTANSSKDIISNIKIIMNQKNLSFKKNNEENQYLYFINEFNHIKITKFITNKHSVNLKDLKRPNFLKILTYISFIYIYHTILKMFLFLLKNKKFNYIKNKRGKFFNDDDRRKNYRDIFKIRFCGIDIYIPK